MKFSIVLSTLVACSEAARLSLNAGSLRPSGPKCGLECLQNLDCSSQNSIDSFTTCIETKCDSDDTTVAHAVERFMEACHTMNSKVMDDSSLDHLKSIYVSSQMAILKRQAASMATNGTSGNGTNSSNSSTSSGSGGTGTSGSTASTTRTGTYATSCSSIADVLDGSCIVRSSEANHKARNSVVAVFGIAAFVAYII